MAGRVLAKTCLEIHQECEEEGVWSRRSNTLESSREYARYECWKVGPNLGRALQGYRHRGRMSILLKGYGREIAFLAMECQ